MTPTTVTLAEAAEMLGVPYIKLWRAVKRGDIKSIISKTIFDKRATIYIPLDEVHVKQEEMRQQAS